ncbi:hypothetical protein [Piscinibacter terrae]|uniref:hypothetical protein n=1 Tax=Piscinibacter terrae TaxID=2496871 RepID=UPI000F5B6906|nr:hypothetical protein [Albitalea terrae]
MGVEYIIRLSEGAQAALSGTTGGNLLSALRAIDQSAGKNPAVSIELSPDGLYTSAITWWTGHSRLRFSARQ